MSKATNGEKGGGDTVPAPNANEVIKGFQRLREEQRMIVSEIQDLDLQKNEHTLVIQTLKGVDSKRRCYRLLGGILVERTVEEVLPALEKNESGIEKVLESYKGQLTKKGTELNDYREKYGIRIQGRGGGPENADPKQQGGGGADESGDKSGSHGASGASSVLVSEH